MKQLDMQLTQADIDTQRKHLIYRLNQCIGYAKSLDMEVRDCPEVRALCTRLSTMMYETRLDGRPTPNQD